MQPTGEAKLGEMGRGTGSLWNACTVDIEDAPAGKQVVARMEIIGEMTDWPPEKIIHRFVEGFNAKR